MFAASQEGYTLKEGQGLTAVVVGEATTTQYKDAELDDDDE